MKLRHVASGLTEQEANLFLFAQELLEAVEFLLPYFESEAGTGDQEKVEEFRSLIAKARGES